jgi:hypothetical protein
MNGGRCSLDEAFELLAPDFEPKAAAARIEWAIHNDDHFPLYCNGKVVEADIAKTAMVVPKSKDRPADIVSTGPWLGWAPGTYTWELEIDAVLALKPRPDTRAESAQATAIAALEKAEAATAETASVRAELEKALVEARAKVEELQAALQAVMEKAEAQAAEAQAAREQAEKASTPSPPPTEDKSKRRGSRERDAIREWADEKWPSGHNHLELRDIIKVADKDKEFRKKFPGAKFPERTKFARALKRRND